MTDASVLRSASLFPSPDDPFFDAFKRLDWANDEGEGLQRDIASYVAMAPYAVWNEWDGDAGAATVIRQIDPSSEREIFEGFARRLGTFLDHCRAALNYMAYQVALIDVATNEKLRPDQVDFPIFRDQARFQKESRTRDLAPEHHRIIESLQPFGDACQGLWILHELAREYRHRILHATHLQSFDADHDFVISGPGQISTHEVLHAGSLIDDRTPILRWRVAGGNDTTRVRPTVAIGVCIDHPLCQGRTCMEVVNEIVSDINQVADALARIVPLERNN